MKKLLRLKSIHLRKQGFSYSEILKTVPVAKSTLSLWLHSVGLSKIQKQKLTLKKLESARRGANIRKTQRVVLSNQIKEAAKSEIGKLEKHDLFLMGVMLYWAEGSKAKEYNPSQGVIFSNSDSCMIKVFLKWLITCLSINPKRINFDIYIHDNQNDRVNSIRNYWVMVTGFHHDKFDRIYYKSNKIKSLRRNKGDNYHGLLRVKVSKSTNLNRRIAGWVEGICFRCGVV